MVQRTEELSFFKAWAPEWLIRCSIFLVLLPALLIFALYYSNVPETCGYYGIEPTDVQFSVVLMYAALVGFFPVDDRFYKYLKPKTYFLIAIFINTVTYFICANTRSLSIFMACRFLQGLACSMLCSFCLSLIFHRLMPQRARAVGYGVFYGTLQASIPLCAIFCSSVLHHFNFNVLFYILIFLQIPGVLLTLAIMNNERIKRPLPLYQIDWTSYLFYTFFLCSIGYILVYGQQLYWFGDIRVKILSIGASLSAILFVSRQLLLKRPLVHIELFRTANVRNGFLLLLLYYVCKGTTGFAINFAQNILGADPVHTIPLWLINILGVVVGMVLAVRFVLIKTDTKALWITGFVALLIYHFLMCFLFSATEDLAELYLPLFIQGFGTGWLMVPIVVFTFSAAPASIAGSVSFLGIASRFTGLSIGIALSNYFQLFLKELHTENNRMYITELNPFYVDKLHTLQNEVTFKTNGTNNSPSLAAGLINKSIQNQVFLRSAMDYYVLMGFLIAAIIILILFLPHVKRVMLLFRSKVLPY